MLTLSRNSFQIATKGVIYIHNTTQIANCVSNTTTSGSLISVRFRIVRECGSEFYIFCVVAAVNQSAVGRLRKIAKRFSAMKSPRQVSLGSGAAHLLHKLKQPFCIFGGTALILLSFQFYEVPYEIDGNTNGNSEDDYFYYQMNRYIIVYTVA